MRRALALLVVLVLYALHQDVWNWRQVHPLLGGFLPVGLAYHAGFSVLSSLSLLLLVKLVWPHYLEEEGVEPEKDERR